MSPDRTATLTIGELARRTGVAAPTLRAWEKRHGFPTAARLPGGHRRYRASDEELVQAVLREREAGLSLAAAVERVTSPARGEPLSLFGALRSRWPELQPYPIVKEAMLALTRALEDEYLARGEPGIVVGGFQRERHFRQSEARWNELASGSEMTFALADFARTRVGSSGPARIRLERDHPLMREWALICETPRFSACFAARERLPARPSASERVFDLVWSVDPEYTRSALEDVAGVIGATAPQAARSLRSTLRARPLPTPDRLSGTWLTNRMVAYVAVLARRARRAPKTPAAPACARG
jgi:DNA-binding transcriptional MerR regulator